MKIGDKINQNVKDYYEIFLYCIKEGKSVDEAEGIANYDLSIKKYISERSIEDLAEKIEAYKKEAGL